MTVVSTTKDHFSSAPRFRPEKQRKRRDTDVRELLATLQYQWLLSHLVAERLLEWMVRGSWAEGWEAG